MIVAPSNELLVHKLGLIVKLCTCMGTLVEHLLCIWLQSVPANAKVHS